MTFRGADGAYRHDQIDWEQMTPDKFEEFPDYFKLALMLAVVNEACEIANGNDVAAAREDGILSESIVKRPICTAPAKRQMCMWLAAPGDCWSVTSITA
jgi:hypothetical protein